MNILEDVNAHVVNYAGIWNCVNGHDGDCNLNDKGRLLLQQRNVLLKHFSQQGDLDKNTPCRDLLR